MKSAKVRSNLMIIVGVLFLGFAGLRAATSLVRPASPPLQPSPTVVAQAATHTATFPPPTASLVPATPTPSVVEAAPTEQAIATASRKATSTRDVAAVSFTATSSPLAILTQAATASPSATPEVVATSTATATASPSVTAVLTATATRSPTALVAATPAFPRIVIQKIGVNAGLVKVSWSVVETSDGYVAEWETASPDVVAHHLGNAQPGEAGNVVLSGHGSEQGVFSRLSELGPGDEIRIEISDAETYVYGVAESVRLPEVGALFQERLANASYIGPTDDARLTLVTCWPAWAYTHRVVVVAKPKAR